MEQDLSKAFNLKRKLIVCDHSSHFLDPLNHLHVINLRSEQIYFAANAYSLDTFWLIKLYVLGRVHSKKLKYSFLFFSVSELVRLEESFGDLW